MNQLRSIFSKQILVIASLLVTVFACKEELIIPLPDVQKLGVVDLGNSESSEDIFIRFNLSFSMESVRIAIVPANLDFNVEVASALSENQYMEVEIESTPAVEVRTFLTDIVDVKGNSISHFEQYKIHVFFVEQGQVLVPNEYEEIELREVSPFVGDYKGTWDDNLHTGVGVSAKIKFEASNIISGDFFATPDFEPYGGAASEGAVNDGGIKIVVDGNGNIEHFEYNQVMLTYKGGCPGKYTGTGKYSALAFEVDYTGEDCDGIHEGGKLILFRLF
ncbi:MAG: hypothetical protein JXQ90_10010 [Cyclobacteriaceae bacterium]